jgi:hypothetical protein
MNISISGAKVTLFGSTYGAIKPGDSCSLILCNNPTSSFFSYKSRITRANPEGVGLEIINLDIALP